uniref:Helicase n=1 Tax=Aureoumbra lagunensis TaxID=44058 RepID=A0A6S8ED22_9STRA
MSSASEESLEDEVRNDSDDKKKRLDALLEKKKIGNTQSSTIDRSISKTKSKEINSPRQLTQQTSLTDRCALLAQEINKKRKESQIKHELKTICPDLELKEHQERGVKWLADLENANVNGILADEMGLGKTVQAIAFIALGHASCSTKKEHEIALVIAPASTLGNWKKDFTRFAPHLRIIIYAGADREQFRPNFIDVVITTYSAWERDSAIADREMFTQLKISRLILDEGHVMKNPKSQRARRLALLQPRIAKLILTGTPVQNNPLELLCLLKFLNPNLFSGLPNDLNEIADSLPLAELKSAMAPFVLRRTKTEVLDTLPPKVVHTQILNLDLEQRDIYENILRRNTLTAQNSQNLFTELRKAANHPLLLRHRYDEKSLNTIIQTCLFESHFGTSATETMIRNELAGYCDLDLHYICLQYKNLEHLRFDDNKLYQASTKFQYLQKLLPQLKQQNHKVLLFSQWVRLLDLLEHMCSHLGLETCRLDGSTDIRDRQQLVDNFNSSNSAFDIFLLSTRAGGLGINLVGADTVVLHDCDFNPEIDRQAVDRCHRIGQTKEVSVYRLVAKDTVDQSILDLAQRKAIVNNHLNHHFNDTQQSPEDTDLTAIDDSVFVTLVEQAIRQSAQLALSSQTDTCTCKEEEDALPSASASPQKKHNTKKRVITQESSNDDASSSSSLALLPPPTEILTKQNKKKKASSSPPQDTTQKKKTSSYFS